MNASGDNELAVRLAQRLLANPHPPGGYPSVELFPGGVPDDLTGAVVVPSDARLLGTAVERRDGELSAVQAIIDIDKPLGPALEAYERELRIAGWSDVSFRPATGFMTSNGGPPLMYRKGRGGPMLMVHPVARDAGATELRLRIDFNVPEVVPLPHHRPEAMDLMPALYPPDGVEMEGGAGSGGDASWSSQATARTDMPVPQLESFFAAQLAGDGWTRLEGESGKTTAWSLWRVGAKGDWRAILIALASPEDDERWLIIHLQGRSGRRSGGPRTALSGLVRH